MVVEQEDHRVILNEVKSRMEALRCLKRHLAKVIFTTMIAEREGRLAQALDT